MAYTVRVTEPLYLSLHDNVTVYSPPLPSGGVVMLYILNILLGLWLCVLFLCSCTIENALHPTLT